MAKKDKAAQSKAFRMTGTECAEFVVTNKKAIASRLRGKREDIEDAIGEVVCKCLQVETGFGSLLKWKVDPFAIERTEEEWLSLLTWQCRARLSALRSKNEYWYDPDIIKWFKTADDVDGLHPVDATEQADDDDETSDDAKLSRQCRIVKYMISEEDRRNSNYHPIPGLSCDEEINVEAAYAVLDDLINDGFVSKRDIAIWKASVMYQGDRQEIAAEFEVTPNNKDQIVHKANGKLSKFGPSLHQKNIRRLSGAAA